MKNPKRWIIYSALALPVIILAAFMAMLDPIARRDFFSEFRSNTAKQFGFEAETEAEMDAVAASDVAAGSLAGEGTAGGVAVGGQGDGGPGDGGPASGGSGRGGFDPAQLFARRDVDADGKLTGDEIGDRMRENLAQLDTDQDGALNLEEVQNGIQQMRANRGGGSGGSGAGFGGDSREGKPDRPQRPE